MHSLTNGILKASEEELLSQSFDDLARLDSCSSQQDVEKAIKKYSSILQSFIHILQRGSNKDSNKDSAVSCLFGEYTEIIYYIPNSANVFNSYFFFTAVSEYNESNDSKSMGGTNTRS